MNDIIQRNPGKIIRAGILEAKKHRQETTDGNLMLVRLARFWGWIQYRQCHIRDIHEKITPLVPNRCQYMIMASMFLMAMANRPIRLVVLKARKLGVSTFVQAFFYFCCKFYRNQVASMLAHQTDSTSEIFEITRTIGLYDRLNRPKRNRQVLYFRNESRYSCHTAGSENIGAGGTPNMLHRSELALWPSGKKREADYTSGNAVPKTPTSIIVDESTARGQELFWGRFKAAHRDDHGFEPLFMPWFLDETLYGKTPTTGLKLTDEEVKLIQRAECWGLEIPMKAIAWRREKMTDIGEVATKQEYPSTPEEAIESEQGLVLPGMSECIIPKLPFDYEPVEWSQRVGGWDYGYRDPTVVISSVYRDQVLYIIDVYRAVGELAEHFAIHVMRGHRYFCDPSATGPREELQAECNRIGTHATLVPAPRGRGEREPMRVKDEWNAVRKLIDEGRLCIMADCAEQLLLEADNLFWNPKTGEPDKVRGNTWGHFDTLDALRYNVMGILTSDAPLIIRQKGYERKPSRREMLRA